jgi:hypothetical protein
MQNGVTEYYHPAYKKYSVRFVDGKCHVFHDDEEIPIIGKSHIMIEMVTVKVNKNNISDFIAECVTHRKLKRNQVLIHNDGYDFNYNLDNLLIKNLPCNFIRNDNDEIVKDTSGYIIVDEDGKEKFY